ncbi:MAG: efflux RND transporter periplasmic adaptor subunit [Treponema sp.]|nr:efflux RND transporter periplasmic adaptor subunit [Treponema sp.]
MKRKSILIPVLLMLAAISVTGCDRINQFLAVVGILEVPDIEVNEIPVFAVNTVQAVQGQIQDYLIFSGDIVAGATVDAYPEAAGRITALYVSVGRWVNRGDPIAEIDPSRPGMTFMTSIATAPISGTIVMLPAQLGMTVTQAVPLARIAGGSGLEIKLNIAERFISKIAMNLTCEITLDAWPGEVFNGSISTISPTVDSTSRTMEVRVNVRDSQSRLKQGMFAKVRVITERKENIVKIPSSAVINRFGEQYVYVIGQDLSDPRITVVRKRIIVPGIIIDGVVEVLSGLEANEEIVIRGQTLLDDGSRVNVIERVTPLSAD